MSRKRKSQWSLPNPIAAVDSNDVSSAVDLLDQHFIRLKKIDMILLNDTIGYDIGEIPDNCHVIDCGGDMQDLTDKLEPYYAKSIAWLVPDRIKDKSAFIYSIMDSMLEIDDLRVILFSEDVDLVREIGKLISSKEATMQKRCGIFYKGDVKSRKYLHREIEHIRQKYQERNPPPRDDIDLNDPNPDSYAVVDDEDLLQPPPAKRLKPDEGSTNAPTNASSSSSPPINFEETMNMIQRELIQFSSRVDSLASTPQLRFEAIFSQLKELKSSVEDLVLSLNFGTAVPIGLPEVHGNLD